MTTTHTQLIDGAAHSAKTTISDTQQLANDTLGLLRDGAEAVRDQAAPMIKRIARVGEVARSGIKSVREGSEQLRGKALRASATVISYTKEKPVRAVLIAAAAGAALATLISLLTRLTSSRIQETPV